jgi:predicted negative regulator of RcsB-dependent stress response
VKDGAGPARFSQEVFVARLTRKELKTDKFALEVEQTVDFFEEHRAEVIRYGLIALAVLLVLVALWYYRGKQQAARQEALANAIQVQEAPVGAPQPGAPLSFPTQQVKDQAAQAAFSDVASKYSGSDEGTVARYYLASIAADQGKTDQAEKLFQQVADSGNKNYASLAKLALAQIDFSSGRAAQGEQLLRGLIDHPTDFVSKDQATVTLAKQLATTKPDEAKKLIEPLRLSRDSGVAQIAIQLSSDLNRR